MLICDYGKANRQVTVCGRCAPPAVPVLIAGADDISHLVDFAALAAVQAQGARLVGPMSRPFFLSWALRRAEALRRKDDPKRTGPRRA